MNSEKYINVLDECLWPVLTKHFTSDRWTLQEDNAPCHVSVRTTQCKRDNYIPTLPWPPQSPDLNIIENVWRTLKIQLKRRVNDIKTKQDLIDAVQDIWYKLPLHYIQSLFQSFSTRLKTVMRGKGQITKYQDLRWRAIRAKKSPSSCSLHFVLVPKEKWKSPCNFTKSLC
jgi:hypothetical protein